MSIAYQKLNELKSIREKLDYVLQADLREVGYDPKRAEDVLEQSLQWADSLNDMPAKIEILADYGSVKSFLGKPKEALKIFADAMILSKNHHYPKGEVELYIRKSNHLWSLGDYDTAFDLVKNAVEIAKRENFPFEIAWTNYFIANYYLDLNQLEDAEKHYRLSYDSFENIVVSERENEDAWLMGLGRALNGLGEVNTRQGNYEIALKYNLEALEIHQNTPNQRPNPVSISRSLNDIGNVYKKLKQYNKAFEYYQESLALRKQVQIKQAILTTTIELGELCLLAQKHEKAEKVLQEAIKIGEEINAKPKLIRAYLFMANNCEKLNKPWNALKYYNKFYETKVSVLGDENSAKIKNLNNKYELERSEQEAQIERLKNVELKQAYKEIEEKNKNITESIHYAKRIQEAILPPESLIEKYAPNSFIFWKPKDIVSGDFYWLSEVNNQLLITVADCTGHGVPGAFMTMLGNSLLNHIVNDQNITKPHEVLAELDQRVIKTLNQGEGAGTQDGMDLVLAEINKDTQTITLASAKSTSLLIKENGEVYTYKGDIYPIGSTQYQHKNYTTQEISYQKGDMFYMFSDGFQDQFGGEFGQKYMRKRFREFLQRIADKSPQEQRYLLEQELLSWQGKEGQTDDILVLGLGF